MSFAPQGECVKSVKRVKRVKRSFLVGWPSLIDALLDVESQRSGGCSFACWFGGYPEGSPLFDQDDQGDQI
jgi:hypothetical protein